MDNKSKNKKKINSIINLDRFDFKNGDVYIGKYKVTEDRVVTKEGIGLYETFDGDSYFGIWEDDIPKNYLIIKFFESGKYKGKISTPHLLYNSSDGSYHYPDGTKIKCSWNNGIPDGVINMTDPRGYSWSGCYDDEYSQIVFYPENHLLPKHGYKWPKRHKPLVTVTQPKDKLDKNSEELNRLAIEEIF